MTVYLISALPVTQIQSSLSTNKPEMCVIHAGRVLSAWYAQQRITCAAS
jgi:hypothetical protein